MKINFDDEEMKKKMKVFDDFLEEFIEKVKDQHKEEEPEINLEFLHLKKCYEKACTICDPYEYDVRQKNLLHAIAQFLIRECDHYED